MIDICFVVNIVGKLVIMLGVVMVLLMVVDFWVGDLYWKSFLEVLILIMLVGGLIMLVMCDV